MSSGARETRAQLSAALARELRESKGLGASLFRAAASRSGLTATDLQVVDLLESEGPLTAGQLADRTGLTTGAVTGMLNRLEEAGLVRRERDPADGRRVVVRLVPGSDTARGDGSVFAGLGRAWEALAADYSDEQLAVLLAFLQRSNALAQQEMLRLREAPSGPSGERDFASTPLGELTSGRLVATGIAHLTVRADPTMADLYQARFKGSLPEVKVKDGTVTIRSSRLWMLSGSQREAEIALNAAIPWQITIQGGASEVNADLGGLALTGLEVKGGMSMIRLHLPVPSGVVPIRISGGASMITVRRPAGVAARLHLTGWVSTFVFDDQTFDDLGNNVRLQSAGYQETDPHYEIAVASSASMVTIATE